MSIFFFLFLFLSNGPVRADEIPKKMLILSPFHSYFINQDLEKELNKSLLRVIAKRKDYHLLLSKEMINLTPYSDIEVHQVDIIIIKTNDDFDIQAQLSNIKDKTVIKFLKKKNVVLKNILKEVDQLAFQLLSY